jgi:hypothetical protein
VEDALVLELKCVRLASEQTAPCVNYLRLPAVPSVFW